MPKTLTITEAAKALSITRQAIHIAIMLERLKAMYEDGHWNIKREDLQEYIKEKYDRKHSKYNGEKLFDMNRGTISLARASELLKEDYNHMYYLVRSGKLRAKRKGKAYVLKIADLNEYSKKNFGGKELNFTAS